MPDRHPRFSSGQFIRPPHLEHAASFLVKKFDDLTAASRWAETERLAGRPLADGTVALTLNDFQLHHWADDRFVAVLGRTVLPPDPVDLQPGEFPARELDWHQKPAVLTQRRLWQAHAEGRLPSGNAPFTSTVAAGAGFAEEAGDTNHRTATLTVSQTLTVTADVLVEIAAIGAGGPGQSWIRRRSGAATGGGFDVSGVSYFGGAGGGAGAVANTTVRLQAGDTVSVEIGQSVHRSTARVYDGSASFVSVNGVPVLTAPGGQPYQAGITWQNRTDGYAGDYRRWGGSDAGTPPETEATGSRYQNQPNLTVIQSSYLSASAGRFTSLMGTGIRASQGRRGIAVKYGTTSQNGNQYWFFGAGGGGGAGGAAPDGVPTDAAPLTNRREHLVNGSRASNPGGPGVLIPWWPTARSFASGGPSGSIFGPGNSHYAGGAVAAGAPVTYGSGGRGGGGPVNTADRNGSRGSPGAVLIRWPTIGNPLVASTIRSA